MITWPDINKNYPELASVISSGVWHRYGNKGIIDGRLKVILTELNKLIDSECRRSFHAITGEAFNSGDGAYRP